MRMKGVIKVRERKPDIRTLEIAASRIEDDEVRELVEGIIDVLKDYKQRLEWIEAYAEGVH